MRRFRTVTILLVALWLPLQGFGAVVMPFCKHSLAAAADHTAADHAVHQGFGPDHGNSGNTLSLCDDCGYCQLATACTLPAAAPSSLVFVKQPGPSTALAALSGIVLPSPHRPPLLTQS